MSRFVNVLGDRKMRYTDMEKGYHVMVCGHAARSKQSLCVSLSQLLAMCSRLPLLTLVGLWY